MRKGTIIFLNDEDKMPGRELTKSSPTMFDFNIECKELEAADFVVYTQNGLSIVLKNREGRKGFVV